MTEKKVRVRMCSHRWR